MYAWLDTAVSTRHNTLDGTGRTDWSVPCPNRTDSTWSKEVEIFCYLSLLVALPVVVCSRPALTACSLPCPSSSSLSVLGRLGYCVWLFFLVVVVVEVWGSVHRLLRCAQGADRGIFRCCFFLVVALGTPLPGVVVFFLLFFNFGCFMSSCGGSTSARSFSFRVRNVSVRWFREAPSFWLERPSPRFFNGSNNKLSFFLFSSLFTHDSPPQPL